MVKEEQQRKEEENEIANEERGEDFYHTGLRGYCPGTLSHVLLGRPVLETVKNIVRCLSRLNSSFIYVGNVQSGKRTNLTLACELTNSTLFRVRTGGLKEYKEDMAQAIRMAAKGRRMVVVLPTMIARGGSEDVSENGSGSIVPRTPAIQKEEEKEEEKEKEEEEEEGKETKEKKSNKKEVKSKNTQNWILQDIARLTESMEQGGEYCLSLLTPVEVRALLSRHAVRIQVSFEQFDFLTSNLFFLF